MIGTDMNIHYTTQILWEWGIRCFGKAHMTDPKIRGLRAAEEMVELCQALEVDPDKLHALIDIVYSRPPGDVRKEFGGVMVTTMVLAWNQHMSLEQCLQDEMLRVLSKDAAHFAKRNAEKIQLGLA
jgi:hypothetical protein